MTCPIQTGSVCHKRWREHAPHRPLDFVALRRPSRLSARLGRTVSRERGPEWGSLSAAIGRLRGVLWPPFSGNQSTVSELLADRSARLPLQHCAVMAAQRTLWSTLLLVCLAGASAQQLYQRPANFSGDCLPDTVRAATFSAVFPSDFFVTGGTVSSQDQSTTVRCLAMPPAR